MKNPHLVIHVSPESQVVITERRDGRDIQQDCLPLETLNAMGFDRASERIGGQVLRTLAYWYTNEFFPFLDLRLEREFQHELDMITSLQSRSFKKKTKAHIDTIDALINDVVIAQPEMVRSKIISNWPTIRDEIQKYQN